MISFKEYLKNIEPFLEDARMTGPGTGNTVGTHNDGPGSGFAGAGGMAFLPSHFTNTETLQNKLASLDGVVKKSLDNLNVNQGRIPLVKRESRIMFLRKEMNPIYVHLQDGTRLYFTRGEWERAGKPDTGARVAVYLQRRANDNSDEPSQIHHIQII